MSSPPAGGKRYKGEVIAVVPDEWLLVWRITDGRESLRAFVGLDVAPVELPRINNTEQFEQGIVRGAMAALHAHLGDETEDFAVAHPARAPPAPASA